MEEQLLIENAFGTHWFICDTAYICSDDDQWNVVAHRADNEYMHKIKINSHANVTKWLPKTTCLLYESNGGRSPPICETLELDELVQVQLSTHNTSLGEFYEYEMMFKGGKLLNCYSWMGNFIAAWKSTELFRKRQKD